MIGKEVLYTTYLTGNKESKRGVVLDKLRLAYIEEGQVAYEDVYLIAEVDGGLIDRVSHIDVYSVLD